MFSCPACYGQGKTYGGDSECHYCNGNGVVTTEKYVELTSNQTNPVSTINLTKEEAGVIYRNLCNVWLNRDDNFDLANETVKRLGRFANGKEI